MLANNTLAVLLVPRIRLAVDTEPTHSPTFRAALMTNDQKQSLSHRAILLATDRGQSIIGEVVNGQANVIAYSAYGDQSAQQEVATGLGFNGQLREMRTRWYLLGNGYRAYNPRLMRFHSPDSWSPFGRGGLNAYVYCVGDPVNRSDPTGHSGLLALLAPARVWGAIGTYISSQGTVMNVVNILRHGGRVTMANGLGAISGLTGAAAGVLAMSDYAPQMTQFLSTTSVITGAASTYAAASPYLGVRASRTAAPRSIAPRYAARGTELIPDYRHIGLDEDPYLNIEWYDPPDIRHSSYSPSYFDPDSSNSIPSNAPSPVYSMQDPLKFSRSVLSPSSSLAYLLRRRALNRMDGLRTSGIAIRQRQ